MNTLEKLQQDSKLDSDTQWPQISQNNKSSGARAEVASWAAPQEVTHKELKVLQWKMFVLTMIQMTVCKIRDVCCRKSTENLCNCSQLSFMQYFGLTEHFQPKLTAVSSEKLKSHIYVAWPAQNNIQPKLTTSWGTHFAARKPDTSFRNWWRLIQSSKDEEYRPQMNANVASLFGGCGNRRLYLDQCCVFTYGYNIIDQLTSK